MPMYPFIPLPISVSTPSPDLDALDLCLLRVAGWTHERGPFGTVLKPPPRTRSVVAVRQGSSTG
jgi:hypothetical protein